MFIHTRHVEMVVLMLRLEQGCLERLNISLNLWENKYPAIAMTECVKKYCWFNDVFMIHTETGSLL